MSGIGDKPKVAGNEVAVSGAEGPKHKDMSVAIVPPSHDRVEKGIGRFEEMLAVVPAAIEGKESKGFFGRAMDVVTAAPAAATKAMDAGVKLWNAAEARSAKAGVEATKELAEAGTVLADLSKSVGLDKVAEKSASLVKVAMSGGLYTKGKLKEDDLTKEKLLDEDLLKDLNTKFESDTAKTKEKSSRGWLAGAAGAAARALSPNESARKNLTDKLAKNIYAVRALNLLSIPRRSKVSEVLTKAQIDAKPNAADIRKFLGLAPSDTRDFQLLKMKSGDYFFVPTAAKPEGKEIVFFQKEAPGVFSVIPLDGSTPPTKPRNSVAEAAVLWAFGEGNWSTLNDPTQGEEKLTKQQGLKNELEELKNKTESLTVDLPIIEKNLKDVNDKLLEKKLPIGHKQALSEMQKHLEAEVKVMKFDLGQIEREMQQLGQVLALFQSHIGSVEQIAERPSSVVIEPVEEEEAEPVVQKVAEPVVPGVDDLPPPPPSIADLPQPVFNLDDLPPPPPPPVMAAPEPPAMPAPPAPPEPPAPKVIVPPAMPGVDRSGLLSQIQAGKTLKKASTGPDEVKETGSKLNNQLANNIKQRREALGESDSEDEGNKDDWN